MTLEELKALWDAAVAEAAKDPSNKDLQKKSAEAQTAYEEAKAKAEEEEEDPADNKKKSDPELDDSKLDDKTKAYLKKLRDENAKHRNQKKDLASKLKVSEEQKQGILKVLGLADDEKPEDKVKKLQGESQTLAFDNAVLAQAVEHGIPSSGVKYFKFLLSEAASELGEGEELSEEKIAELVQDVKSKHSSKGANTSVGKDGKKVPKPDGGGSNSDVTLEQFLAMGVMARSDLYTKKPELYQQLATQAKAKKKLI